MDTIQNVRMLISLATGSKETLTAWVNTNSQNTKRNQLTSKKTILEREKNSFKKEIRLKKPTES